MLVYQRVEVFKKGHLRFRIWTDNPDIFEPQDNNSVLLECLEILLSTLDFEMIVYFFNTYLHNNFL